jgi:two-component system, response regulator YesN
VHGSIITWMKEPPDNTRLPMSGPVRRSSRVLVVDDSEVTRRLLCRLVSQSGYCVVGEASSLTSAVEAVEHAVPDAVLLDIHLPDGDGFDLTRRLLEAHPQMRVLLTSACAEDSFYSRSKLVGARGFVPKAELARIDFSAYW